MRTAQIKSFMPVENKGVTDTRICAEPFRDAVCQSDLATTTAQIPLKNDGANPSDHNASKINGEKGSYWRRADDKRTAQIPDFEDEQNQRLANRALFAPRKTEYIECEDDIDFMIGDMDYAKAAPKRPGAER